MYDSKPERGEKRTCLSCEAKFYDMGRTPMACPKCGTEFVEVIRPAPLPRHMRKKTFFGKGGPSQPLEAEEGGPPPADEEASEDEDHDPDEEKGIDSEDETEIEEIEE